MLGLQSLLRFNYPKEHPTSSRDSQLIFTRTELNHTDGFASSGVSNCNITQPINPTRV
jgi:hypothetical protein